MARRWKNKAHALGGGGVRREHQWHGGYDQPAPQGNVAEKFSGYHALLGAHADQVLIGACNLVLWLIWGFRQPSADPAEWRGRTKPESKFSSEMQEKQLGAYGSLLGLFWHCFGGYF